MAKSTWFPQQEILPEHKELLVRQVYAWFITSDKQIAIVGRKDKFQFPGGKPEQSETFLQTLERELYEESGIILNDYNVTPRFFGYYLVENDTSGDSRPYLQIRYLVSVDVKSSDIELSVNERLEDTDTLEEVKFVSLEELPNHIPWTEGLEEYSVVKSLLASSL